MKNSQDTATMMSLTRETKKVPYVTGFCGTGRHEGTQVFSDKGTMMRSCSGVFVIQGKTYICRCDCHVAFQQIREITGLSTQIEAPLIPPMDLIGSLYGPSSTPAGPAPALPPTHQGNPSTVPTAGAMPEPGAVSVPSLVPSVRIFAPISPQPEQFKPTPSGQRARGQLEAEVARVIYRLFAAGGSPLTPIDCAMMVNPASPPSQGAVYSIFQRWSRQGLCELGAKPFRFMSLTDQGKRTLARWE